MEHRGEDPLDVARILERDKELVVLAELAYQLAWVRLPPGDRDLAYDISQSAAAAFLSRRDQIVNPEAYVTRITLNLLIKLSEERRRVAVTDPAGETFEVADPAAEESLEQMLDRVLAEVVFEQDVAPFLAERERQVLQLQYLDELPRKDVAARLGIGVEGVKDARRRVRNKVQRRIDPDAAGGWLT